MIENLFGVEHSASKGLLGLNMGEVKVYPSIGLIREILNHPAGTKIGLEYSPKLDRPHLIGNRRALVPPEQRYYWQQLRSICRSAGHKVVYLEDFPTYEEYVRKAFELDTVMRQFQQASSDKEGKDLYAHGYKLQAEVDYIWIVKREAAIIKSILTKKPNIVVIGKGHSQYLTQNIEELSAGGIKIDKYQTESVDPSYHYLLELDPRAIASADLDDAVTPNPDIAIERACLERRYKAVTEGRVTDGKPNFIGTWDIDIPARGLFEVYVDNVGNEHGGTIEDCLGSAIFFGDISDEQVSITKLYTPSGSSDEAFVQGSIRFQGSRVGDIYKGRYEFLLANGESQPGREFTLRQI